VKIQNPSNRNPVLTQIIQPNPKEREGEPKKGEELQKIVQKK